MSIYNIGSTMASDKQFHKLPTFKLRVLGPRALSPILIKLLKLLPCETPVNLSLKNQTFSLKTNTNYIQFTSSTQVKLFLHLHHMYLMWLISDH